MLRTLISIVALLLTVAVEARVFVLPIENEIDARAWQHTRRACSRAVEEGADVFVVRLNTYGGELNSADSIRTALLRMPMTTAVYIDHNAASAGALIAIACDSIYMSPGSSIGAATVVDGSGQPMPDKYQSYMSSIMRSTAEHKGKRVVGDTVEWRRNPVVAAAMVRGDSIVSFTAAEAVDAGFAEAVVPNFDGVLERLNSATAETETYRPTLTDDIIGFLSSAAVRAVLVMLILGGIYMEMHTPGLGFAAAVALVAACLYFLPMMIAGSMAAWIVIMLIAGIVLIALELFVIPGFGVCGIAGILAVLVALCAAITPPVGEGEEYTLALLAKPVAITLVGIAGAVAIVGWLTSRHGPKFVRKHSELMLTQDIKDGYIGVDMQPAEFVGRKAVTMTVLRPAGKVVLDGKTYDAVSTGDFIDAETHVRIVRYENAQLYVEPLNPLEYNQQ